jgi:subtilase family serine protease
MLMRRWRLLVAGEVGVAAALALTASPALATSPLAHAARLGPAPAGQSIPLVLPLVADLHGLAQLARSVTTPGSPQYAQYRSIPWLARRFGASDTTRRKVVAYLRAVGATKVKIDATGLFADATLPVRVAQRLFATPLARFHAAAKGTFIAPTGQITVPAALRGLVTGVVGLNTEPVVAPQRLHAQRLAHAAASTQPSSAAARTGTPSGCSAGTTAGEINGNPATAGFTPNQYLTAYGVDPLHGAGLTGTGERVALIEIDGFRLSDIQTFASCFGLSLPKVQGYGVGFRHPLPPGGESTLDLEVLDATAPGLDGIDVYESHPNAAEVLQALTTPFQNHKFKPQVISASLGLCEPALVDAVGVRGIVSTESALEMAAISGTTFLASSGDQGSADCTGPDGTPIDALAVNYPASSPWVTAVGGTNFTLNGSNQITKQLVWNDTSLEPGAAAGGGFSQVFRRPDYQGGTVQQDRRALPDVSFLSDVIPGYAVYCSAEGDCINPETPTPWQTVGGTSAATPLMAGGIALVDQALRARQREDVGLANPLLYTAGRSPSLTAQVFSDVTQYSNDVGPYIPGNGQPLGCCNAGGGFDAASGWGSVNLSGFSSFALQIQPPEIRLSLPAHQRPIAHRAILASVWCAAACRIAAFANVQVGHTRPFEVDSKVFNLSSRGNKKIALKFSGKELRRLRDALRKHRRVVATVFGGLIAGARSLQHQTAGQPLKITG